MKMVHNGIEYGDMQMIAETYDHTIAEGVSPPQRRDKREEGEKGLKKGG